MRAATARLIDDTPLVAPGAIEALCAHALAEYPCECLGYIDQAGGYVPLRNVAARPTHFSVPDRHVFADLLEQDAIRALCHSHPGGPDCPSETDMRAQIELEVPFVIVSTNGQACTPPFVWGDQVADDAPLIGRTFRHGVHDCYGMIRAHRRAEYGEALPDFARNWEWWLERTAGEKDLYMAHFAEAGYVPVDRNHPEPGDVWLAAVRSAGPNHAGVYLGNGLVLHHPASLLPHDPTRLSKRDSLARWIPLTSAWPWLRRG